MTQTWSKIGDGGTAEIYLNESGQVVKLFREGFSESGALNEYGKSVWAYEAGLPAAKPLGMELHGGRPAIRLERIEGESLLERLYREPETAEEAARTFAAYQVELNERPADKLGDDQRERLVQRIGWTDRLQEEVKAAVLAELAKLPQGDRLCHGDYHPGNIMETPEGWRVIDWIDATCGHPLYDPARTLLLLGFGTEEGGARGVMEQAAETFRCAYLEEYAQRSGYSAEEIERWMLPLAAARLVEPIPETEKTKLLGWVRQRLTEQI